MNAGTITNVPRCDSAPSSLPAQPPTWNSGIAEIHTPPSGKPTRIAVKRAALMIPRFAIESRLKRAHLGPRVDAVTAERGRLLVDRLLCTLEEDEHSVVDDVDGARHQPGTVKLSPAGSGDDDGTRRERTRVEPECEALDGAEPAFRPAIELAEVVAGDVLHDLPARVRPRTVRQQDADADHEVTHCPETMAQRAGEVVEQAFGERRVSGRIE